MMSALVRAAMQLVRGRGLACGRHANIIRNYLFRCPAIVPFGFILAPHHPIDNDSRHIAGVDRCVTAGRFALLVRRGWQ